MVGRYAVVLFAGLALSNLASATAEGQEPVILQGQVADAETGLPVMGAFVFQAESNRGSLTDSLGYFALGLEPAPVYQIRVNQLGYMDFMFEVPADSVYGMLLLHIPPDPVEIEGLTVLAERLANRRAGPFGVADILDREALLASPGNNGYDLLLRTMPFVSLCAPPSEALCLAGRMRMGEQRPIQVCIDDRPVPPDFTETSLASVDPRALYLVEVYSRAGEVRMYTPGYIKRLISVGGTLPPLSFGCSGALGGIGGSLDLGG